jgi:DNA-binding MarR family transcriptional regulator
MAHKQNNPLPPVRPNALERTLTYRLHLLHKLTDQTSQQAYPEVTGLSLSAGRCLATVGAFEPVSVKVLAERANLNKGQASRAAQALVEQGLVAKHDSPHDGRGVVLTLTEAGHAVWQNTMKLIETRNQQIFGSLNEAEQATLSQLLDRLIACAQSKRGM